MNAFFPKFILSIILLILWCPSSWAQQPATKIKVAVSIIPQKFLVEQIAGQSVQVYTLISQNQSPHIFEPAPQQMSAVMTSDLYFTIGLPFEKRLLAKIAVNNPKLKIVKTQEGIKAQNLAQDPHIWLSPSLVKIQAENIYQALAAYHPNRKQEFQKNLAAFLERLDAVRKEIAEQLAPYSGRSILVYHPAFGYFAAEFGLKQISIEQEGKSPSANQLIAIIDVAKKNNTKTIFVEPQFSPRHAEKIAQAIGAQIVILDPFAENYFSNLNTITEKIISSFKP